MKNVLTPLHLQTAVEYLGSSQVEGSSTYQAGSGGVNMRHSNDDVVQIRDCRYALTRFEYKSSWGSQILHSVRL
jgi:hypothetical protein